MRRLAPALIALALVVAACGDDDTVTPAATVPPPTSQSTTTTTTEPPTTTTVPQGFTVTSDDGLVTIEVTPEAIDNDPGIEVRRLDPEEFPEELAGAAQNPNTRVYSMEPAGLSFSAPVRVTRRIPLEGFGDVGGDQIPLASLLTTTADGSGFEMLQNHELSRTDDSLVVSAETTHFSPLIGVSEQVFVEARVVEVTDRFTRDIGIDFSWSNGVPLQPPSDLTFDNSTFIDRTETIFGEPTATGFKVVCPPGATTLLGAMEVEMILRAVESTSDTTGLTGAPMLAGTNLDGRFKVNAPITLVCRPTIAPDGTIEMTLNVDHPGGEEFVPGGDFAGGASAYYGHLDRAIPDLLVGLIRDDDGDGQVGQTDTMFPLQPTTVDGGLTKFVLPLFTFGDYFFYFVDGTALSEPTVISTQVSVRDGATVIIGGIIRDRQPAAVSGIPFLGDLPYIGRVFADETTDEQEVELLVLLTPRLLSPIGD